jgi:hypothetical protein
MSLSASESALRRHSPVGLVRLAAARRVPPRQAGNFLLLAQKKVTKEEGLNTILPNFCIEGSAVDGLRSYDHPSATWISPTQVATPSNRHFALGLSTATPLWPRHRDDRVSEALCFGYFHLCQQMKVTAGRARPAGCRAANNLPAAQQHKQAQQQTNG